MSCSVRTLHQTWKYWIWRWSTYCESFLYAWVEKMNVCNSSCMQCSDTVSLQCGSSRVISEILTDWISCRSVNTCKVSLQCESSHVFLGFLTDWISCRSVNTCKVSLQCGSSRVVSNVQVMLFCLYFASALIVLLSSVIVWWLFAFIG